MSPPTDIPPLYGLVLAGGRGERIGFEKIALRVSGEFLVRRQIALLNRFAERAFVGIRHDQRGHEAVSDLACVEDAAPSAGPMTGVRSAFRCRPNAAWLVLACDMPLVTDTTLRTLVEARDPRRWATALMASDGLFEPVLAIYEPAIRPLLEQRAADGRYSLRDALADADVRLECVDDDRVLRSINTPEDLAAAQAGFRARSSPSP